MERIHLSLPLPKSNWRQSKCRVLNMMSVIRCGAMGPDADMWYVNMVVIRKVERLMSCCIMFTNSNVFLLLKGALDLEHHACTYSTRHSTSIYGIWIMPMVSPCSSWPFKKQVETHTFFNIFIVQPHQACSYMQYTCHLVSHSQLDPFLLCCSCPLQPRALLETSHHCIKDTHSLLKIARTIISKKKLSHHTSKHWSLNMPRRD